ncbi:MAG: DUF350 domain-containing protein [Polyangiaceae bacterium]
MSTAYVAAFGIATSLVLLLLHRVIRRRGSSLKSYGRELSEKNGAYGYVAAGDALAVVLVSAGVVKEAVHGEDLKTDILMCALFGVAALAVLQIVGTIGTRLLMGGRLRKAIDSGNVAAGIAAGAHYVASGIITSRAFAGSSLRELSLSIFFFLIAVLTHQALVALFRAHTTYDDGEEIAGGNLAAATSYAGLSIAVSLFVARALDGEFVSWKASLTGYALVCAASLMLFPVRQLVVEGALLGTKPSFRGGALDKRIAWDRNVAVAALEAAVYVGSALATGVLA